MHEAKGLEQRARRPFIAIPRAAEMTVIASVTILRGIGKFATGEFGRDKLAGPIGIMQIKTACKRYIREFEEACIAAKAREQARAADQKSRETPA